MKVVFLLVVLAVAAYAAPFADEAQDDLDLDFPVFDMILPEEHSIAKRSAEPEPIFGRLLRRIFGRRRRYRRRRIFY